MKRQGSKPSGLESTRVETTDGEAFASHFRTSFRTLWAVAASIVRDASLAEDVVQEAALVAFAKRSEFQPGSNFAAWMTQIVRYVALNQTRRERRHRSETVTHEAFDHLQAGENSRPAAWRAASAEASARVADAGVDRAVAVALAEVSEAARACLLLRTLEGMEYSQISALLGIPEGTAMSHVHRTRRVLRERLAHLAPERSGGPTV